MASIQGIYLALFGRPVDPAGLAFWNEQTNNGQDLSALIGGLTSSEEYLSRFEGQSNEQVVGSIYQSLFGRAPDAEGLAFFLGALESGSIETIAIQILDGAQNEDLLVVQNKEEAANIFTESLDTPEEIAAYVGDAAAAQARDLIDDVTADPASIPTTEQIEAAIEELGEEETPPPPPPPPVDPGPDPVEASFDAGVLTLSADDDYILTLDGDDVVIGQAGTTESFFVALAELDEIEIVQTGAKLDVDVSNIDELGDLTISGAGKFNVDNVDFGDIEFGALTAPDLSDLSFEGLAADGFLPDQLQVNGNVQDAFKALWVGLDLQYYTVVGGPVATNESFVKLANDYVDYLNSGIGLALLDIVQTKDGLPNFNVRQQSLHDNLLGNIADETVSGRIAAYDAAILADQPPTGYPVDLRSTAAAAFGDRPVANGYVDSPTNAAAAAWDFANGLIRFTDDNGILALDFGVEDTVILARKVDPQGITFSRPFGDVEVVEQYDTIQDAVDGAMEGDLIFVAPGTYVGDVVVDKDLSFFGTGRIADGLFSKAIITGESAGAFDATFTVQSGVTVAIEGLTINATGGYGGIYLVGDNDGSGIFGNTIIAGSGNGLLAGSGQDGLFIAGNVFDRADDFDQPTQLVYINGTASTGVASTNVFISNNSFSGDVGAGVVLGIEATGSRVILNDFRGSTSSYAIVEDFGDNDLASDFAFDDAFFGNVPGDDLVLLAGGGVRFGFPEVA